MSIIALVLLQKWLQALSTCLRPGSTNKSNLSLDREIAGVFAKALGVWLDFTRVGEHRQLAMNTILMVDITRSVCTQYPTALQWIMDDIGHAGEPPGMLSSSLPTTNSRHLMERQNIKLCRAGVNWLPEHACSLSTLNIQWLGNVHQMKDDNITYVMYGELATGHLKLTGTHPDSWEQLAATAMASATPFEKERQDGKGIELNHWTPGGHEGDSANSGLHLCLKCLQERLSCNDRISEQPLQTLPEDRSWPTKALLLPNEKDGYLLPVITLIQFPSDKHANFFFLFACIHILVWMDVPRINGWMFFGWLQ